MAKYKLLRDFLGKKKGEIIEVSDIHVDYFTRYQLIDNPEKEEKPTKPVKKQ